MSATDVAAQVGGPAGWFAGGVSVLLSFLPRLVVAAFVLLVASLVGSTLGDGVRRLVDRYRFGERVVATPLGDAVDDPGTVGRLLGGFVQYYFVLVGFVVAVGLVGLNRLASLLTGAVSYAPGLLAAIVIVCGGLVVAAYVGRLVRDATALENTGLSAAAGTAVQAVVSVFVALIALDTAGVSTVLLDTFATAFAYGLALTAALGVGLGVGLGAQDYVADHVDDWVATVRDGAAD